ncbi:hypothetical protein MmiHf6_02660 [Methanimicrococcus hongohii]|uniref:Indolepyruvate oxidoreductase subunit IorA n=1 Tax=Methanimicrococcus hongohii TaxID=3028295 RepID=A0AA96ZTR3_9EURY|nr:thiamine pyrophosphate-dependent enzyme [Methanimicrococcus sp. Hf6]WNY22972.1 hypothetical protein MmiHf6_02660 [Methanimicrococcus sp. Hf6]
MTILSGIQTAIQSAADNSVSAVFGVPGSPVTDLVDAFKESPEFSDKTEWFVNEKIAFEWALGYSFSGKRSLVIVKHVGMNVLADPLMTSMIHTIGAGIVILAGDDPEVTGSQNSQDSRYYGSLSRSPVFDPSAPQEIYDYLSEAFRLSEKIKAPVIVRVTAAVLNEESDVKSSEIVFVLDFPSGLKTDKSVWQYRMKGRYQRSHFANDAVSEQASVDFCRVEKNNGSKSEKLGIIASGYCYSRVQNVLKSVSEKNITLAPENISILKLGIVSPLPISLIRKFLEKYETVLVVEESEPFIEDQIRVFGNVIGKRSGHLPFGSTTEAHILSAIEKSGSPTVPISTNMEMFKRPAGSPDFCGDSFYPLFYEMLGRLKKQTNVLVSGDIGCSMHGILEPYSVLDSAVSLGTAIGIGSGGSAAFSKKSITVIGDFGFFHSGLLSLIEAAEKGVSVLVYVMCNGAAAMTGGQIAYNPEKTARAAIDAGLNSGSKLNSELNSGLNSGSNTFLSFDFDVSSKDVKEKMKLLFEASLKEIEKEGVSVIIVRWK